MRPISLLLCLFLTLSQPAPALSHPYEALANQQKSLEAALQVNAGRQAYLSRHTALHPAFEVPFLLKSGLKLERSCLQLLHTLVAGYQQHLEETAGIPEIWGGGMGAAEAIIRRDTALPAFKDEEESEEDEIDACLAEVLDTTDFENLTLTSSKDWLWPLPAGYVSAGTWAYPNGGLHLGLDIAAPLYSRVLAVGSGVVVYANNPVDTNCGYLGNACGWPNGGGNTIHVLVSMEDGLYGVSYFHLSSTLYVRPGQTFSKGAVLALSGNSGNSTGPHCHVEIIRLNLSLEQAVRQFAATSDFSWGCGWSQPATASAFGRRLRPETLLNTR